MTAIHDARSVFDALADRREPRLADAVTTWLFDLGGAGTWALRVDHGELRVAAAAPADGPAPTVRLRLSEDELVRLARGDDRQNVFTAVLRGALAFDGDPDLVQQLDALLPLPAAWRADA